MNGGGLFEDAPLPVGEVSMPAPVEEQKPEGIYWIHVLCSTLEHDPILYIFCMMSIFTVLMHMHLTLYIFLTIKHIR